MSLASPARHISEGVFKMILHFSLESSQLRPQMLWSRDKLSHLDSWPAESNPWMKSNDYCYGHWKRWTLGLGNQPDTGVRKKGE